MANPEWTDPLDWEEPVPEYVEKLELLPAHMRHAMRNWIENGNRSYPPGDFLTAVLCNDLMGAFARADDENAKALRQYAVYLYCYAPSGCFGSKERFAAWQGLLSAQVQPC